MWASTIGSSAPRPTAGTTSVNKSAKSLRITSPHWRQILPQRVVFDPPDLTPASFALYRTCDPARRLVSSDASVANDATIEERSMKPPRFDYLAPKSFDEALT